MTKEQLADQLIAILFPPLEQSEEGWWLDRSVCDIDGAIIDIERANGECDTVCMATLKRVAQRLQEAETLTEPYRKPPIPYRAPKTVNPELTDGDGA